MLKREARIALRKQNQQLLKVNKELDNFVYNISHNLRSPLTSVMGLINLVRLEENNQNISHLHEMMQSSIVKLDNVLNEILDFSRNERNPIAVDKIDWQELIDAAYEKLAHMEHREKIERHLDLRNGISFYSDRVRLELVFRNILSNSIAYFDEEKASFIKIRITVRELDAEIVIEDNGIGIDQTIQGKVFNMFYRGTERSPGAGLGLYIVKEIIEKLKGSIKLFSEEKKGTRITIILPNLILRS